MKVCCEGLFYLWESSDSNAAWIPTLHPSAEVSLPIWGFVSSLSGFIVTELTNKAETVNHTFVFRHKFSYEYVTLLSMPLHCIQKL